MVLPLTVIPNWLRETSEALLNNMGASINTKEHLSTSMGGT